MSGPAGTEAGAASGGGHRAGVVALLGRPNAGKSTLLNRLLGEKLAIVTARPQTTRSRLLGVLTLPQAQILLLDTPGLQPGSKPLDAALCEMAHAAAEDCDVALLLVDPLERASSELAKILTEQVARGRPVLVVGSKLDRPDVRRAAWPPPGYAGASEYLRVSARTGEGMEALLAALVRRLPEAPRLFPGDALSDRPLRFLAAELVREAAFDELSQELPYALAVEVVDWKQPRPDLAVVRAHLLVQRASQKRIAIGTGGAVIKRIGSRARVGIEALAGCKVHLDLWVKLEPRWWRSPKRLKNLGYS
jgi:GTP-binding protein Era